MTDSFKTKYVKYAEEAVKPIRLKRNATPGTLFNLTSILNSIIS